MSPLYSYDVICQDCGYKVYVAVVTEGGYRCGACLIRLGEQVHQRVEEVCMLHDGMKALAAAVWGSREK
jgi:hypothetical protein